jgi:HlyD family secretion protein
MKKSALLMIMAVGAVVLWIVWPRTAAVLGILEGNGRVEGDQAAVGAKVGGRIIRLPIREGQTLKAGELVVQLSSEQAKAQLEQAEHDLHAAREEAGQAIARISVSEREVKVRETAVQLAEQESTARIGEAEVTLETARARFPQLEAERQRAEKDFNRSRELLARELIAPQEADNAKAAFQSAKAVEEVARKQILQAEENLKLARTTRIAVELRKKELEQAKERLGETKIASQAAKARVQSLEAREVEARANVTDTRVVAPFDGTILRKLVEEGQVVAPGTPLVTFVDLSKLYVKVYLPEGEIAKVRLGNAARVYVDAFPKKYFEAAVSEVSQQAEFTPRDIHMKDERVKLVFAVKLALKDPQGFLKPGMPADSKIQWQADGHWGDGLE